VGECFVGIWMALLRIWAFQKPARRLEDEMARRKVSEFNRTREDHRTPARQPEGRSAAQCALPQLNVICRPLEALQIDRRNARTHSAKQINQIAASIKQFGFNNPILVDADSMVVAGHGRLAAARELGLGEVPTIRLDHLSPDQRRAYVLADNRLAELAGWDDELLTIELEYLSKIDLDFSVELTGFTTVDIDRLLQASDTEDDGADDLPQPLKVPVSRLGDLWLLGPHRLLCGNALDPEAFNTLLQGEAAQMVLSDPPFNVKIEGHVGGAGKIHHREFAMASGEMSQPEFTAFLTKALTLLAKHSADGAINFIFMDWRHMNELQTAGAQAYNELKNLCIWNKDNGGMGSFYRSKHELVFVYKVGTKPHINNFGLGQDGRYRTNVWDYPGINSLRPGRMDELAMHPTVKPVALVADAIQDCSKRRGIILDSFCGSGTTLIAAEKTGRFARGIELDPLYVDTIIRRWEAFTGESARHAESNRTFGDLGESDLKDRSTPLAPQAKQSIRQAKAKVGRRLSSETVTK